jgi:hypothetical protein
MQIDALELGLGNGQKDKIFTTSNQTVLSLREHSASFGEHSASFREHSASFREHSAPICSKNLLDETIPSKIDPLMFGVELGTEGCSGTEGVDSGTKGVDPGRKLSGSRDKRSGFLLKGVDSRCVPR